MNHTLFVSKKIFLYVVGLFLLALGATFSILASIGVSPVTSLPYALALITPFSVGVTTVIANFLFIVLQAVLLKTVQWKGFLLQLVISFLFGFFMDATIFLTGGLPAANTWPLIVLYFALSLVIVALGLLCYFTSQLPMMPYDALTYVIANKWSFLFGKAKITSDLVNVTISLLLCLIFMHSFGSIGIGTFIAAYAIGKIVGIVLARFQPALKRWLQPH